MILKCLHSTFDFQFQHMFIKHRVANRICQSLLRSTKFLDPYQTNSKVVNRIYSYHIQTSVVAKLKEPNYRYFKHISYFCTCVTMYMLTKTHRNLISKTNRKLLFSFHQTRKQPTPLDKMFRLEIQFLISSYYVER